MREIVSPLSGPFTTFGQATIDIYKVGAYRPELAYSFFDEYYRKGRQPVNFLQAIDHSATSNATMTGDYGPELVTNGAFDNDGEGWSTTGEAEFVNGQARIYSSDGTLAQILISGLLETGKVYEVTYQVTDSLSGGLLSVDGSATVYPSEVGWHKVLLTPNNTNFGIKRQSGVTDIYIDNISVREIPKIQWRPHNLLTYSEDFSASAWSKTATTVTANAAVAPDGTQTADKISHTSTSAEFRQTPTTVSGAGYVNGIFIKYIDHQWFRINLDGTSFWFDVQNGVIGTDNTSGASVTALSDDWWYVTAPITAPDTSFSLLYYMVSANNSTTEVSGTSAYIWGAHLYRSDLGGMADVPADDRVIPSATKYVRTAGRVIGSELVTNGTFDTDTSGWTAILGASLSLSGGGVRVEEDGVDGSTGRAYQIITTEVGKVYRLSVDLVATNDNFEVYVNTSTNFGGAIASSSTETTAQTVELYFVATATSTYIILGAGTSTAGAYATYDNISVKEIDVNPAQARYLPRRGHHAYNGSQWVNKGLLHESESRTNLIDHSQDISSWATNGSGNVTKTSSNDVSPDGGLNAYDVEDTGTGDDFVYRNISISANTSYYTFSIFVRKTTSDSHYLNLAVYLSGGTAKYKQATFDTNNGEFTSGDFDSTTVQDCGLWWRASVTTSNNGTNTQVQTRIYPAFNTDGSYTKVQATTGLKTVYGAQLEEGSTPSSYIPTSGSTVTRAAETLTIPAANLPWPEPVVIGEEIWVASINVGVNWTDNGDDTYTISSGGGQVSVPYSFTDGSVYRIDWTVSGNTTGQITPRLASASGLVPDAISGDSESGNGSFSAYLVADSTSSHGGLYASSTFNGTVSNISVKEINPLALSIQMSGEMTYADTGGFPEVYLIQWYADSSNFISAFIGANLGTGQFRVRQNDGGTLDQSIQADIDYFTPGINVPFNISSRHGSTFINGAVDGVALTEDTTPVGLPDLSSIDLNLGYDFMGTIDTFRVWAEDIGNTGIAEATEPSEDATLFLSFDGTETSYIDFEWSE